MKYLKEAINQGAIEKGSKANLSAFLGISRTVISDVLAEKRGLPLDACFKLADMTGADLARLIAENEAITAKAEKAEFWKKKLMEFEKLAACVLLSVTFFVSPSPAEAAPMLDKYLSTLYIMSNRMGRAF